MRLNVLILGAVFAVSMISCKKDSDNNPDPGGNPTADQKLKDSVKLYAQDLYLWYDKIPNNFNAQSYDDPNKIMEAIRQYSSEPGFTGAVDRWSFAVTKAEWDGVSSGVSGDFGMGVFFLTNSDLRVSYVERESPAGKAGIKRSWKIKSINGSTNITPSNANTIVDAVYNSQSSVFVFTKPDGNDVNVTLNAASYQEHPFYLDTVYNIGGKKTGYFVFNSFLGDTNEIKTEFARIFNRFSTQAVQDVIVDLRYNGGGYVSVQNILADYLVPTAGNGQLMEEEKFNSKYTTFNETINFNKKGTLNLNRLFVIVSQNTASASELLINSLKPYMDVQLIGPSATHGKPVGFFPIPVGDWYIFPVSFRTVNKNGEGNYFNGISLNKQVMDGLDKDWGDVNEGPLKSVLGYINSGTYAKSGLVTESQGLSAEVQGGNKDLGKTKFKGAIARKSLR